MATLDPIRPDDPHVKAIIFLFVVAAHYVCGFTSTWDPCRQVIMEWLYYTCITVLPDVSHCLINEKRPIAIDHCRIYTQHKAMLQNNSTSIKALWWRHQIKAVSALLAFCAGNSPVTGEFPLQRPVTRSFVFSLICTWINRWVNNHEAVLYEYVL